MKRLLIMCLIGFLLGSVAAYIVVFFTFNGVEETFTHFAVEGANSAQ